ncbi:MFS transporter [Salinispora fenicalii]|uniref:MFS transporter n=1 Tax=Salinispora fenicalii TaxID=1137263 RepID=UPI0004B783A0|nr:MFS transporter [Salinispora fenicalii]
MAPIPTDEAGRWHPRLALLLLLSASTLTVMAGAIITPVLEVIRGELGVDGTAAGMILTAHGLSIALCSPLVGWLIDRFGVRLPLAGGLLLYGLAGGAGLVVESYVALIFSRLLFGLGAAAVFSGTTVALLSFYRGSMQDRVMGWRSAAISGGGIAWPLLGGAVGTLSWHAPFGIYLIGVPLGLASLVLLPHRGQTQSGPRGKVLPLLQQPSVLSLYAFQMLVSALMYVVAVFLPQRLAQLDVERPFVVSLFLVTMSISATAAGLFYGKLRARLGYPVLLRIAFVGWAVGFLLIAFTGVAWLMLPALATCGASMGVLIPALTVLIGESAPPTLRGQVTALLGAAAFLGQFASPLVFGPLIDATSVADGFLAAAVLSLVAMAVSSTSILGTAASKVDAAQKEEEGERHVTEVAER